MTDPAFNERLARAHVASGAQELEEAAQKSDVGAVEEAAEEYLASLEHLAQSTQQASDELLKGNTKRTV